MGMQQLYGSGENYKAINPIGGPQICIDTPIDGTINVDRPNGLIPLKIEFNEITSTYFIYTKRSLY